jgi:hypothetical protein
MEEAQDADRDRFLSWWYFDDGRRLGVEAEFPAAQGAVVAKALDRLAEQLPAMPGDGDATCSGARRADALVALCSSRLARRRSRPGHGGRPRTHWCARVRERRL